MSEIVQIISSLGFPIAVALWFMIVDYKQNKQMLEVLQELTKAVNNNTATTQKLSEKF
jgi:hypothetical protein